MKDTIFVLDTFNGISVTKKYILNFHNRFFDKNKRKLSDKEYSEIIQSKRYVFSVDHLSINQNKLFFYVDGVYTGLYFINLSDDSLNLCEGYHMYPPHCSDSNQEFLVIHEQSSMIDKEDLPVPSKKEKQYYLQSITLKH